ncbi:type II toxin-antitoxin system VapC family toxin [Deinococcus sp.]|uniref:type II toxin-antitoxin system VapC family toxin n=1 Tax=Deinococcus sp. TaxID=47478 RepID=UPI0025B8DAF9|nr:type II toxin-antitoxin system VapC family toxin [Deinococcus sp.]
MTILYLDSSALAKLYLDEDNTEQQKVIDLLGEYPKVATCIIAYAEVSGIFARLFHGGTLDEADYADKLGRFTADWQTVIVLDVTPEVNSRAAQVMKAQRGLRAIDALHLAAALTLRGSVSLRFVTFDTRLEEVANKLMAEAVA